MKSILISIKPEWVAKILNQGKTIEVRKTAPKCDLPIDVYIYCTNDRNGFLTTDAFQYFVLSKKAWAAKSGYYYNFNGKVVAKFTLREVTQFRYFSIWEAIGKGPTKKQREVSDKSRLSLLDLSIYAKGKPLYLWHISDLVIFDKPRELSEFMPPKWDKCGVKDKNGLYQCNKCPYGDKANIQCKRKPLTKAPQSWGYCEECYPGATMRKIELPKEVDVKQYKKEK